MNIPSDQFLGLHNHESHELIDPEQSDRFVNIAYCVTCGSNCYGGETRAYCRCCVLADLEAQKTVLEDKVTELEETLTAIQVKCARAVHEYAFHGTDTFAEEILVMITGVDPDDE